MTPEQKKELRRLAHTVEEISEALAAHDAAVEAGDDPDTDVATLQLDVQAAGEELAAAVLKVTGL